MKKKIISITALALAVCLAVASFASCSALKNEDIIKAVEAASEKVNAEKTRKISVDDVVVFEKDGETTTVRSKDCFVINAATDEKPFTVRSTGSYAINKKDPSISWDYLLDGETGYIILVNDGQKTKYSEEEMTAERLFGTENGFDFSILDVTTGKATKSTAGKNVTYIFSWAKDELGGFVEANETVETAITIALGAAADSEEATYEVTDAVVMYVINEGGYLSRSYFKLLLTVTDGDKTFEMTVEKAEGLDSVAADACVIDVAGYKAAFDAIEETEEPSETDQGRETEKENPNVSDGSGENVEELEIHIKTRGAGGLTGGIKYEIDKYLKMDFKRMIVKHMN